MRLYEDEIRSVEGATGGTDARDHTFGQSTGKVRTLAAQYERKREIEQRTDQIVDALFFVDSGKPIKTIRNCWATACRRAGFPGLLFHDLRRSTARNLVRAGISTKLAKDYLGHQTYSIFDRYAIEDAELLEEQAAKLQELYDRMEEEHVERKVVSLDG